MDKTNGNDLNNHANSKELIERVYEDRNTNSLTSKVIESQTQLVFDSAVIFFYIIQSELNKKVYN